MELTSYQAETIRFSQVRRGLDPDEVTRFQRRVARVLAEYEREMAAARDQIIRLERQRDGLRSDEAAARQTYLAAARTKDELVAEATQLAAEVKEAALAEAAAIRSRAEDEAATLLEEARDRAGEEQRRIDDETARLRRRLAQLRTAVFDIEDRMRGLAQTTLAETRVVADLIALESEGSRDIRSPVPESGPEQKPAAPAVPDKARSGELSFYERRLSGLRDRLDSARG